ncbi:NAD-dependent deacetylase [Bacillus daqingensis]|uniref:protein acetyllysine N-acetyltransferase n=1 Tax=Bacillus daqingensis TaxID=872396 RepID=A0ABV9NPJ7_9BACI
MRNAEEWTTLLSIGTEGGTIELKGAERYDGWWDFRLRTDESSEGVTYHTAQGAKEDGLKLLDGIAWMSLYPLYVSPEAAGAVEKKVLHHKYRNESSFMAWLEACYPEAERKAALLANWLLTAERTVLFTGAGMSTESNLPDFRSKEGWWRRVDPRTVATPEAMNQDYPLFKDFYAARMASLEAAVPHAGYYVISSWESRGMVQAVATQNVDGLHRKAGSQRVYELHGRLQAVRCSRCDEEAGEADFRKGRPCQICGGKLRPGVVLFGEILPEKDWDEALLAVQKADLVVTIGTSLEVYPANQLPLMSKGRSVYINADYSGTASDFDLVLEGRAGEVLQEVDRLLKSVQL